MFYLGGEYWIGDIKGTRLVWPYSLNVRETLSYLGADPLSPTAALISHATQFPSLSATAQVLPFPLFELSCHFL